MGLFYFSLFHTALPKSGGGVCIEWTKSQLV
nr:MAG TPA: hypothetical protein [Caudoviricetes sp.]